MSDVRDFTKSISDLLISDVLSKHEIKSDKKSAIPEEQKEQIRRLVNDLQAQVDQFMKEQANKTTVVPAQRSYEPRSYAMESEEREELDWRVQARESDRSE